MIGRQEDSGCGGRIGAGALILNRTDAQTRLSRETATLLAWRSTATSLAVSISVVKLGRLPWQGEDIEPLADLGVIARPDVQQFVLFGSPPSSMRSASVGCWRPRIGGRTTMSVPRLRRRHPREIVVLQAFGERVRAGFVAGACASLLIPCALAFDPLNVVKDATSQRDGEQDRYHASSHAGNPPLGDNGWVPSIESAEKDPGPFLPLADGGRH
jgi:hypothetical protein